MPVGRGTASGPMGEAVDDELQQDDPQRHQRHRHVLAQRAAGRVGRSAGEPGPAGTCIAPGDGHDGGFARQEMFEGACVSCHGWTGESAISSLAKLTGTAAVNDPSAVERRTDRDLTGPGRRRRDDAIAMPAFGNAYSDTEMAAIANYVTGRFGRSASRITPQEVAELRKQGAN